MTIEEVRTLQGSPAPIRNFVWYQEYVDRDGYERRYYQVSPCDDDHDVEAIQRRKGFHHWLSSDEIDAADAIQKEWMRRMAK